MHSDETERPSSAQRTKDDADNEAEAATEEQSEDEESDPAEKIVDFDWEDLQHRYHRAMDQCHNEEAQLTQEWENLMDVLLTTSAWLLRELLTNFLVLPHLGVIRERARDWPDLLKVTTPSESRVTY
jgi:hypothetical protein